MSESALENETTADTTTLDGFGRSWVIPTRRHLSHLRRMRDEGRRGWAGPDLILVETFLGAEQFEELVDLDPDEQELSDFADEIGRRLGFGGSGN